MNPYPYRPFVYTIKPHDNLFSLAQQYNTTVDAIIAANPGIDPGALYIGQRINIWPGHRNPGQNYRPSADCISRAEFELSNHIRMLWEQHITWTRLTIVSMVFNLPDVEMVTQRLLRNPKDFADALSPLYGAAAASEFENLLRQHLVVAADLVTAAKAGNTRAATEAERIWYNNARNIAAFLASINPFWSSQEWERMLFRHLALVKDEAVFMLNGQYQADIDLYTEMERQALMMADVMTEGIVRQFYGQFR